MEIMIPLFCEFPYGWLPIDPASKDPLLNCSTCWEVGQLREGRWTRDGFECAECVMEATKRIERAWEDMERILEDIRNRKSEERRLKVGTRRREDKKAAR